MRIIIIRWFFPFLILVAVNFWWPALVRADLMLSPAKIEMMMKLGEKSERQLVLTNQEAVPMRVTVTFEDFAPAAGAYSLIPYLSVSPVVFEVPAHTTVSVPVITALPATAPVGSFHGVIIFSFTPVEEMPSTGVITTSRLGALVFVRLAEARATTSGALNQFGLLDGRWFRANAPLTFYLNYTNAGNVYLNPYGTITLRNRLTATEQPQVETIDPWFVLPESSRTREITLARGLPFGWYEARLALNRGYADTVDERTISFFVWSWSIGASLIAGLIIFATVVWFIIKKLKK